MRKITTILLTLCTFLICSESFAAINNERVLAGTIKRAFVDYKDADEIYIKTGYGDCNGKYWEIESDLTYSFGVIGTLSAPTVYYVYIDDSAATYPSLNAASFTHSATAPTWNDANQGWYNGDDRCIGAVLLKTTGDIRGFKALGDNKICFTELLQAGTNLPKNAGWQSPQFDTDNITPINTSQIFYYAVTQENTGYVVIRIGTQFNTYNQIANYSYQSSVPVSAWMDVIPGGDRTIQVDADSPTSTHKMNSWLKGWKIER